MYTVARLRTRNCLLLTKPENYVFTRKKKCMCTYGKTSVQITSHDVVHIKYELRVKDLFSCSYFAHIMNLVIDPQKIQ